MRKECFRRLFSTFWTISWRKSQAVPPFREYGGTSLPRERHAGFSYRWPRPFLWLEVAGYGDVLAFLEAVEGVETLVLAPCLDVDEG